MKMLNTSLLAVAALACFSTIGYGAPVSCGSDLIPNGTGVGDPIVCPTIGDAGFQVVLITLTIDSDYTGWLSGDPVVNFDYATGGPVSFTPIPQQHVITIPASDPPNSLPSTTFSFSVLNPGPISGITITPTSSVVGGEVTGSSSEVTIDYVETPVTITQTSGTPEPATLGLLGIALAGTGMAMRKRKQ